MSLSALSAAVLADSPKFYWKCQEASGNLQDSSGNAFHSNGGTATSDISYGLAGPCGDDLAIAFAGGFTDAALSRNAVPFTATDNTTYEWWMRYVSGNSAAFIVGNHSSNGIYFSFTTDKPRISVAGVAHLGVFAGTFSTATWHHLVAVRRSGTWEYYLNGAVDTASAGTSAPAAPTTQTWIGYFAGAMVYRTAHVAAYDTALSAARIDAHYDAALAVAQTPPYANVTIR